MTDKELNSLIAAGKNINNYFGEDYFSANGIDTDAEATDMRDEINESKKIVQYMMCFSSLADVVSKAVHEYKNKKQIRIDMPRAMHDIMLLIPDNELCRTLHNNYEKYTYSYHESGDDIIIDVQHSRNKTMRIVASPF